MINKMKLSLKGERIRKVPEVLLLFWVVKILTTAMGEATLDFFVKRYNPATVVILGGLVLAIIIAVQLAAPKYFAPLYWLAVTMVAIVGTMAADVLHVGFGIPYVVSTALFAILLTLIFVVWRVYEKTLSIHSIYTLRRELFYWATVMTTFALGTAAGDMTATTLHLGYFDSGILFAILFAIPAVSYWKFNLNPILAFWAAYILTRPLGASFADWIGVSHARGGLNYGTGSVSIILTILIIIAVAYLTIRQPDINKSHAA
jgi:uncharacterized membrane-anchored protein